MKLRNLVATIPSFIHTFSYILLPIVFVAIGFIVNTQENAVLNESEFRSLAFTFASSITGFMITAFAIIISLPDGKEVVKLIRGDYEKKIYYNMFLGIIFSLSTIVLLLVSNTTECGFYTFFASLGNVVSVTYYLFRITLKISNR